MIGSGIFVLPGVAFGTTGPSVALAFLFSSICILPAALSKAELATAMPTSGGTYIYIDRTFGPFAGTVSGLGLFSSILFKASFSLVGIGAYFSVLSNYPLLPTILGFLGIICVLNILGVGKVSSFLTAILFISVISIFILSMFALPQWNSSNFTTMLPYGWEGFAATSAMVYISYAGVTKIAAIAGEVIEPEKNIPRGIILSLFIATLLYCGVSLILAGTYHYQDIAGELKPIYRLAYDVGGPIIGAVFAVIAVLTMSNTANAGILAGSRFPFAMSRDRLLPEFLGKLHPKFLTPIYSIILAVGIVAGILISLEDVSKIAKFASAFKILMFIMVNISVIILRESRTQWYKPNFKSPFYPLLQILGILSGIALLLSIGKLALIALAVIGIPGICLYFFYSRQRIKRRGVLGIKGIKSIPDPEPSREDTSLGEAEVLVSLFGRERSSEMLIEMGLALVDEGDVEVGYIQELPEQVNLDDYIAPSAQLRSLRRRVHAMAKDKERKIIFESLPSHDVAKTVFELSQSLHSKWLIIEWWGRGGGKLTFYNPIGWLKSHLHSHLAIFRDQGVRYIRKIMVLINEDQNDPLVIDTAEHLASVYKASLTLVRFNSSESNTQEVEKLLRDLSGSMSAPRSIKVILGEKEIESIIQESVEHDLLILGSSDPSLKESFQGSFDDRIIAKAACSVLAVHTASIEI